MEDLLKLMINTSEIKLVCEVRRCDTDSSGFELPEGRDNYALWNWCVDGEENEWPGFWHAKDCIEDMINKNKGE